MDLSHLVETPLDVWCKLIDIQFTAVICQKCCCGILPHSPVCVYWSTRDATNGGFYSYRCEALVAATNQSEYYTNCDNYSELHSTESYSAVQTETVYSDFCCDGYSVGEFEVQAMTQLSHTCISISELEQNSTQDIQFDQTDISYATLEMFLCHKPLLLHNSATLVSTATQGTNRQHLQFSCSAPADLLLSTSYAYKAHHSDYACTTPRFYRYQLCISVNGVVFSTAVVGIANLRDQSEVFDPGIT